MERKKLERQNPWQLVKNAKLYSVMRPWRKQQLLPNRTQALTTLEKTPKG